uniref:Crystallin beta-gamma domain containing 1 n=1 Tax=Leptobrachium leishanense TaxID=445787 RepID=A0A8C5PM10_9ANUR
MSKAQATESPKKDTARKPVLGKIGIFFNTGKKKPIRSLSESPTSPTGPSSRSNEKETSSERRRTQVASPTDSKTPNLPSPVVRVERRLSDSQSKKENSNGESNNGLHSDGNCSVKETETPIASASGSTIKPYPSPSAKYFVKPAVPSPGRRLEGESSKITSRKLQVFSQEINIREDSSKITPKKSTKFSVKSSDSKPKGPDKPVQASDNTVASSPTKLTLQGASQSNTKEQTSLSPALSKPGETADKVEVTGDISPGESSPVKNILSGSPQESPKANGSNENANNPKVLTFDIYLSKQSESGSPASQEGYSNGESMETSPGHRRSGKKRRSLKSQSSQNGEKADCISPQEQGLDRNFSFEGVTESPTTPEQKTKPGPLSPEAHSLVSANQDTKAGANRKLSPKGESDKDKQQHPASSHLRKKKENQSASAVPASPTARKVQSRDYPFRNPPAAAARAAEGNQTVSTTKDSSSEKQTAPGSLSGNYGEDCVERSCELTEESVSPAAGALPEDKQQGSNQGVPNCPLPAKAEAVTPTTPSPVSLDVTTFKTSLKENARSTVTSKLHLPPKPKNVDLSIKPKFSENIESSQELTSGPVIQKGSIANKISIFENKTTTHKQIDFFATKNISQPKKFVERAKLNLGKHPKKIVQKPFSSQARQSSDLKPTGTIKSENSSLEIKEEDTSPTVFDKSKVEPTETDIESVERQMDDSKHGLDTVVVPSDEKGVLSPQSAESPKEYLPTEQSFIPDVTSNSRNKTAESPKEILHTEKSVTTEVTVHGEIKSNELLTAVNSSKSILRPTVGTKDHLLPIVETSTPHINSTASELDSKILLDMGNVNKNNSTRRKVGLVESEVSSTVCTDSVDSSFPATLSHATEKIELNNSKDFSSVQTESPSIKFVPGEDPSKTCESKVISESQSTETISINEQIPDTIQAMDISPSHSGKESFVEELHDEVLKHTSLHEVDPTRSHVEDLKVKQKPHIVTDSQDYQYSYGKSTGSSPPVPVGITENIEETRSADNGQVSVDQRISDFGRGAVVSVVENTSTPEEENHLSESDTQESAQERDKTIHNQENSPHVSTSARASVVTSDGSHMDSLAKKYDADPKTNEIICTDLDNEGLNISHQKTQNAVIHNGVEIKAGASQLNGNESESERCSSLENVENLAKPVRDAQIVQHETTELVEFQDVNVVRECEEVPEKDCASMSNVTPQSVDSKKLPSEGDQIAVAMGQPLADYAKQNGYVSEVLQSNGSPEKSLNVEQHFKGLQGTPEINLNVSVASDENNLDSSSDMEKFAETIRKLESPVPLTQKRKKPRAPKSPGPYYGLPSIREDFLEKILDGDTFSFGLGKKERAIDMAPMALFKLQSRETAEKLLPKRASAEQSMLLKSLKSTREPFSAPQEASDKENTEGTDLAVKRSRIDSMYSGLKSSSIARSEDDVFSPSVTTVSTITTSFATPQQECAQTGKNFEPKMTDSATTAQPRVNETGKDFIHANGSCVQDTVNSLQTDSSKQSQSIPQGSSTTTEKQMEKHPVSLASTQLSDLKLRDHEDSLPYGNGMALPPLQSTPKLDPVKGDIVPNDTTDIFYFKGRDQNSVLPTLVPEGFPGQGVDKINPRPGKVVILTESDGEVAVLEVCNDVADCTSWELTPTVCIKTIRGCWILHEFPNFQGRSIALEEGDLELSNPWGEELQEDSVLSPVVIGSLRHVVKDYRVCQIDLFTEPDGLGIMTSYFDDTEELQVYGKLQRTCSIKVHWGVWLIYEEPGFQGMPYIIEPGEYPNLSFWDAHEAFIGSMRPLKMGSRKVEVPYDPKIILFEKPLFEGRQVELDKEILKLEDLGIEEAEEAVLPFSTVGSMRVLSGLWVGYEKPGFDGHQYLLEEGDYEEWTQWAGFNDLLRSLRPILSDFSTPQLTMYSDKDFDEKGPNINVLGIISNMEETGYGLKTQSINVLSGVWVVYETPDFTGEQYILEKGMYRNFSDWGAKNAKISSVQPIILDTMENPRGSFKVELFSEPDFQGQVQIFEGDTKEIEASFTAMSCKVISGRWAAYEKDNFKGSLWVLEEGCFPNLFSMGCQRDTVIRSLQIINYEFSEPAIILYGKENFQGRKVKIVTETMSILATGYSPDLVSLEVLGGIWVLYEYSNYRGRQIFIKPGKIAQWNQFSGWERIGSLRPLRLKRLYFKLKNKSSGMLMSTNGTLDDIKLLRIQVMEDTGAEDQIWVYHEGTFRCRIAEDCSLATSGSLVTAGSKLGLTLEQTGASTHWNINPDGRIYSRSKPNLVLDIKGGNQYDQQHVILSQVTEGKQAQLWEICIL